LCFVQNLSNTDKLKYRLVAHSRLSRFRRWTTFAPSFGSTSWRLKSDITQDVSDKQKIVSGL